MSETEREEGEGGEEGEVASHVWALTNALCAAVVVASVAAAATTATLCKLTQRLTRALSCN